MCKAAGKETDEPNNTISNSGVPSKVLGLAWDLDGDLFVFDVMKLKNLSGNDSNTKRFILNLLGRLFDTIGFLGPFIMKLKLLIQELWTTNIDSDDELPPLLSHRLQLCCNQLKDIKEILIPRHYFSGLNLCDIISFDIHSFFRCLLEKAYGCVLYLRATTRDNKVLTTLMYPKIFYKANHIISIGTFRMLFVSQTGYASK